MSAYDNDRPRRKLPLVLVLLVVLVVGLIAGGIYLRPRFESQPPQIRLAPDADVIGAAPLEITVLDAGAGLKSLSITLLAPDRTIAAEQFASPVAERKVSVVLAKLPGVKEGPATLRVVARDASLWGWFKGNETVLQKQIAIDLTPPTLELIADDRYISFGGAGALVYKTSADAASSVIDSDFRPAPASSTVISSGAAPITSASGASRTCGGCDSKRGRK